MGSRGAISTAANNEAMEGQSLSVVRGRGLRYAGRLSCCRECPRGGWLVTSEIASILSPMPDLTAATRNETDAAAPPDGEFASFPGSPFLLLQPCLPAGDQPTPIEQLVEGVNDGEVYQTLLGDTGSGKTYTMAN